jgi:hypothetical protein
VAIILSYDYSGTSYSRTFQTLSLKGLDEPDRLHKNQIIHECLNGVLDEQVNGFRKEPIEIEFRPPFSPQDTRFLTRWFCAASKRIIYGNYISEGVTDDKLISSWLYDCELNRNFTVLLFDEHVYYAWNDGIVTDEDMYIKLNIEMSQDATEASPETFTTNVGQLALMETGFPFPVFNSSTHKFFVHFKSALGSSADYPIGTISVVAGNLTFTTFPANGFSPAADGKLHANFAVWLQPV